MCTLHGEYISFTPWTTRSSQLEFNSGSTQDSWLLRRCVCFVEADGISFGILNRGAEGVTSNNSFPILSCMGNRLSTRIYIYMNYLRYSTTGSNLRQVTQLGAALLCWVRTYGVVTTRMELPGFPFSGQLHHRGKMGFPWLHWVLLERSAMDPHGWQ